jgi:hypothetical protein
MPGLATCITCHFTRGRATVSDHARGACTVCHRQRLCAPLAGHAGPMLETLRSADRALHAPPQRCLSRHRGSKQPSRRRATATGITRHRSDSGGTATRYACWHASCAMVRPRRHVCRAVYAPARRADHLGASWPLGRTGSLPGASHAPSGAAYPVAGRSATSPSIPLVSSGQHHDHPAVRPPPHNWPEVVCVLRRRRLVPFQVAALACRFRPPPRLPW